MGRDSQVVAARNCSRPKRSPFHDPNFNVIQVLIDLRMNRDSVATEQFKTASGIEQAIDLAPSVLNAGADGMKIQPTKGPRQA